MKFCGRWERQCRETFKIVVIMDGYTHKLKEAAVRDGRDRSPLTDVEKKWVASVGGQLNWMARQGRADLAYGISRVQQMAGARDPETIKLFNQQGALRDGLSEASRRNGEPRLSGSE